MPGLYINNGNPMNNIKGFSKNELKASLMPDIFHLILFPTEECNFRCVYCYEDFAIGNMQPWLIDATKALLSKKIPHLKHLHLSWFGGEPLVAKKMGVFIILCHFSKMFKNRNDT
jgi:uncharacterized protein